MATVLLTALLLSACAKTPDPDEQASASPQLAWPAPPETARIRFVDAFSSPDELDIRPGLLEIIGSWIAGEQNHRLVRPTSVVVTKNQVLFVADPGAKAVHRFDLARKKYRLIRLEDDQPLRSPIALALAPDGRVFVSDSATDRIYVLTEEDDIAIPFETDEPLAQPTGLAVDGDLLYVVNTRRHEILAFDLLGRLQFRFGKRGAGEGELNFPTMIWADPASHRLWITDSLNFRVQQFDRQGKFISAFGRPGDGTGDLPRPKGLALDHDGNIYVLDSIFNALQVFNRSGELLLYLGQQGREPGEFWLPTGIFIDNRNRIYIADSFNSRVQILQYLGDEG